MVGAAFSPVIATPRGRVGDPPLPGAWRKVVWLVVVALLCAACADRQPDGPGPTRSPPVATPATPSVVPTATAVRESEFQRGVAYVSFKRGELASGASDKTIDEVIQPLGVEWLAIVVTCYQETVGATAIDCGGERTPSDADLVHAIEAAHGRGMKVLLKPHLDPADYPNHHRGEIGFDDEADWRAWFRSYTAFIVRYAALARDSGAEYLVIGTELARTSHRDGDWRRVVAAVRAVYDGPLTYAANHGEEARVGWWDALDAIGVDAYYPLTGENKPTPEQLRAAWGPIVAQLGDLARRWDRPVILTEVGYQSRDGTNRTPWGVPDDRPLDPEEQGQCYQAVFDAFAGQPWWLGVFWWAVTPDPAQGWPDDGDFTPARKPAQEVLREWYGR